MVEDYISKILIDTNKTTYYYLNGGCYIFASKLKQLLGGDILYLVNEYHFVLRLDNRLYDASGNVTSIYKTSKFVSESDFFLKEIV